MLTTRTTVAMPAGTWTVETAQSTAAFVAREKFGNVVRGHIPLVDGAVIADQQNVVSVTTTLDMSGIETGNARRDKDLRSKRFFHTAVRPTMRFVADVVTPSAEGWLVRGDLQVNDRTCPVELDVRIDVATADPHSGTARVFARGVIDKRAAGINAPNWLIRHPVQIEIAATLRRI
jgi:polyisoprenoid-binding protein YceI